MDRGQGQAYWLLVYSTLLSKDSNEVHGGRGKAGGRAGVYDVFDARMKVSVCGLSVLFSHESPWNLQRLVLCLPLCIVVVFVSLL